MVKLRFLLVCLLNVNLCNFKIRTNSNFLISIIISIAFVSKRNWSVTRLKTQTNYLHIHFLFYTIFAILPKITLRAR